MRFPIRPGKAACAGIVVIFLVLPNSLWDRSNAKVAPIPKPKMEAMKKTSDADGRRVKLRKAAR